MAYLFKLVLVQLAASPILYIIWFVDFSYNFKTLKLIKNGISNESKWRDTNITFIGVFIGLHRCPVQQQKLP